MSHQRLQETSAEKKRTIAPSVYNTRGSFTLRYAAMLVLFGMAMMIEGSHRSISGVANLGKALPFPPELQLFAAALEVALGVFALYVGLAFILGFPINTTVQHVAGYFFYIVFVFVLPGLVAAAKDPPGFPAGSALGTAFQVSAMMAASGLCFALQGGQILFTFGLYDASVGKPPHHQPFYKKRTNAYLGALLWTGLWFLIGGSIAATQGEQVVTPFAAAPLFIKFPALQIVSGVIIILSAAVALAINNLASSHFGFKTASTLLFVSYVWCFAVLVQFQAGATIPGGTPAAAALTTVITVVHVMPLFLLHMRASLTRPQSKAPQLALVELS